jgi:hypothetical protein
MAELYRKVCTCSITVDSLFGYTEEDFPLPQMHFVTKLFLTSKEWGKLVINCCCLKQTLHTMNILFQRENMDGFDQDQLFGSLAMDILKYNPTHNANFILGDDELNVPKRLDEVDGDGKFYTFAPPFHGQNHVEIPIIMQTCRRWTKMIQSVENMDDYRNVITEICDTNFAQNSQEWTRMHIIKKFTRDLIYSHNIKTIQRS